MSTSFSSIPLVDLARLRNPATKKTELAVLRDSIFNVGFLYLINNGFEVSRTTFGIFTVRRHEQDNLDGSNVWPATMIITGSHQRGSRPHARGVCYPI